tara:strand:+ start:525 stop:815 length:291 start_codon:yes stop_codon:yes gene_type:complete
LLALYVSNVPENKMAFPKTCFNSTCKCKELKIVREVTLRCSNCNCGVKVEEKFLGVVDEEYSNSCPKHGIKKCSCKDLPEIEQLLFTVVKNRKKES